ncbi:MAG: hypothetical protein QOI12_969 [Alphaproteobacteria bacterium]|jgi:glycosyltransferase involved in cell wall biosynthesis|nr:hypothetical protein [Alphaproteobacteria bacterium]
MSERLNERRNPTRTLAGATILQVVPALREEPNARTAINVALALLQAGARALVAAADGPLVAELRSYGAEWFQLPIDTANPFTRRRNARALETIIAGERVDIVHAQGVAGAWSARRAAAKIAVWFVTTLPDVPPRSRGEFAQTVGALARGDRIIAPSAYSAAPVILRYGIPREQITVIPRGIDTETFDIAAVRQERVDGLRQAWRIAPGDRIVLVPGRVAPWNGQIILPDVARALVDDGFRGGYVFVIVGENRTHRRYARSILKRAQMEGVDHLFRITGHCPDMPSAFATADTVAVPAIEPPILGRVVAQAQSMSRPVVTTDVGILPEQVVVPPQMPEDVRTGWVAKAGDPIDFARALALGLALDDREYQAMCARARQFAEYMFSPDSVAVATRAVYTSLLARDR